MSETKKDQKSWFKTIKLEFKKIIWPEKNKLAKQTVVVLVSATIISIIVAAINMGIQYGLNALMNIQF